MARLEPSSMDIPAAAQTDSTNLVSKFTTSYDDARRTRPVFTDASLFEIVHKILKLEQEQHESHLPDTVKNSSEKTLEKKLTEAYKASGDTENEETAQLKRLIETKLQAADLRQSFAKGITLSTDVSAEVHALQEKHFPQDQDKEASHDPSASKSRIGALDEKALRKKIQRNTVRVKLAGNMYTGTSLSIGQIAAQIMVSQNQWNKQQVERMTVRTMNRIHGNEVHQAEMRREDTEHDTIEKSEDELAFETTLAEVTEEANLEQETAADYSINKGDDHYKTLGVRTDAEPEGRQLAADREATRLSVERVDAIADVQGEFLQVCKDIRSRGGEMNEAEMKIALGNARSDLKDSLTTVVKDYTEGMHKLGKADAILSDSELRSEYEKQFTEAEYKELGDDRNSGLQPHTPILGDRSPAYTTKEGG